MTTQDERGRRLIPSVVDKHAREDPERVWASIPLQDDDLSKGYRDIPYKQLANAVNHAATWMTENLTPSKNNDLPVFSYAGPKDLRWGILAIAAAKCRRRFLLCSLVGTLAVQSHILAAAECADYLFAPEFAAHAEALVAETKAKCPIGAKEVPKLEDWLDAATTISFPYDRSWDEVATEDWLIFHSSGTTAMPKLIPYNHLMFSVMDAAHLFRDSTPIGQDHLSVVTNKRVLTPLPHMFFVGMLAVLGFTVYADSILVMGPSAPVTGSQVTAVLKATKVDSCVIAPSLIEDTCRTAEGLAALRKLKYVMFVGAPISPNTAALLNTHTELVGGTGSTETGGAYTALRPGETDQWEWYSWREINGTQFEPQGDGLYELVYHRKPELSRIQIVFHIYPDLQEYRTKDLYKKHPTRSGLWKYAGRTDDIVIPTSGVNFNPADMEFAIRAHPKVKAALIGGTGRPRVFLLLELLHKKDMEMDRAALLDELWPAVEKANEKCPEYIRLKRDLILISDGARPLPLTAKGTVQRRAALDLYENDVGKLYEAAGL